MVVLFYLQINATLMGELETKMELFVWDNGKEYSDYLICFVRPPTNRMDYDELLRRMKRIGNLLGVVEVRSGMEKNDMNYLEWVKYERSALRDKAVTKASQRMGDRWNTCSLGERQIAVDEELAKLKG